MNGTLYALDAQNGDLVWTFDKPLSNYAPTFAGEVLFQGSTDGSLYAIDAKTGKEVWSYEIGAPLSRGQAVAEGVVLTGAEDGHLYAVNAEDGTALWSFDAGGGPGRLVGVPSVADAVVYIQIADEQQLHVAFVGIDLESGKEVSRYENPATRDFYGVVVDGATAFVASLDTSLFAVDLISGETIWQVETGDAISAMPAVVGGVVYLASQDSTVYAIDSRSGAVLWTYQVDGKMDFGPSVANGVLYVSTFGGTVYAIGGEVGSLPAATPSASPAAADSGTEATPVADSGVQFVWESTGGTPPLMYPVDAAVHPDGTIWVIDSGNNQIQILDADGEFVESWGEFGTGDGQFNFNQNQMPGGGIAIGADGVIYVVDQHNDRVQKFDADRTFVLSWGSTGSDEGQFIDPVGVAIDPDGNVYVSDFRRNVVQKFDADGVFLNYVGKSGTVPGDLGLPIYMDTDADGNLYVAEVQNNRISKFASDGTFLMNFGSRGREAGQFNEANDAEVDDATGLVFTADTENHRVNVFDADGNFVTTFGMFGDDEGQLFLVAAVSLDGEGNLYVVNAGSSKVTKFDVSALLDQEE